MQEARDSVSEYQASKAAAEEKLKEADRAPIREARPVLLLLLMLPLWMLLSLLHQHCAMLPINMCFTFYTSRRKTSLKLSTLVPLTVS